MKIRPKLAWHAMLVLFSLVMTCYVKANFRIEQPASNQAANLVSMNALGQTFSTHYDGLDTLQVYP